MTLDRRLFDWPAVMAGAVVWMTACSAGVPPSEPMAPLRRESATTAPHGRLIRVPAVVEAGTLRVEVRAPATRALAIDNCNGDPGWQLLGLQDTGDRVVWSGEMDACASAPIEIGAGTSRTFAPGNDHGARPVLQPGRYQLVLHTLRWQDGEPVDASLRRSNPFEMRAPAR